MARFGRDFVRAATQPAYLEGLFTAAQDIGSLPARARQDAKLEQYKKLDPLERIEYAIANATTAEQVQQAEAAKTAFMKTESQRAINKLEVARASSVDNPDLQRNYEQSMAGIAAYAGLDASGYVGRTDAEDLRKMQTKAVEDAAGERLLAQQTRAITSAYRSLLSRTDLDEETYEKAVSNFKKIAQEANFGGVIDAVDKNATDTAIRELQHKKLLDDLADKDIYLSSTSPVGTLKTQINASNLPDSIKTVLLGRIKRLEEEYPDFEKKQTWTTAGRKRHDDEYKAINNSFYDEVSNLVTAEEREKNRIRSLRMDLARIASKIPSKSVWAEYVTNAKEEIRQERGVSPFTPSRFDGINEQEINQRAIQLAQKAQQEATLNAVNAARMASNLRSLSLEEVLGTVSEETDEEETTELETKADEIVGL